MTPTLVIYTAAVIPTINLFLFQIATLGASMSDSVGKRGLVLTMEGDIHAKTDQNGSGDEAHITEDLEYGVEIILLKYQTVTH
jgi:hypothetical protein